MDKEIMKMIELFHSPVKTIRQDGTTTIVEFENGQTVPLYGGGLEINYKPPTCSFCGKEGTDEKPLFTIDDKSFICLECNILAMETFLKNGADINLNIGEAFPEAIEEIKKMVENFNQEKVEEKVEPETT